MRRCLRRIGIAVLALVALAVVAYFWLGAVARSRRDAALDAIREAGEPLTLVEMAPPPVPDEENGALVFEEAARLLVEASDGETADPERNAAALARLDEALGRPAWRLDLDDSKGCEIDTSHLLQALQLPGSSTPGRRSASRRVTARPPSTTASASSPSPVSPRTSRR